MGIEPSGHHPKYAFSFSFYVVVVVLGVGFFLLVLGVLGRDPCVMCANVHSIWMRLFAATHSDSEDGVEMSCPPYRQLKGHSVWSHLLNDDGGGDMEMDLLIG